MRSKRCEMDSMMSIQLGGIQALPFETQVIVMSTLMMACKPKNNLSELQRRKTTQMVTRTRARFISPWRLDELTLVRAFLMPLSNTKKRNNEWTLYNSMHWFCQTKLRKSSFWCGCIVTACFSPILYYFLHIIASILDAFDLSYLKVCQKDQWFFNIYTFLSKYLSGCRHVYR